MKSKVLPFVFLSSMLMSALAFDADGVVSVEDGDMNYVPSEFSYQGLAQVIDDAYLHIEGVKVLYTRRYFNLVERIRIPNRFSFHVVFSAQNKEVGQEMQSSCRFFVDYEDVGDNNSIIRKVVIDTCKVWVARFGKFDEFRPRGYQHSAPVWRSYGEVIGLELVDLYKLVPELDSPFPSED